MSESSDAAPGFVAASSHHGGVTTPILPDAAAGLLEVAAGKTMLTHPATGRGLLLLADGSRFEGELFGADAVAEGELVFTTGMTGYQESLTDPSFAGQILTFTYPLIGNYGIHDGASESASVWPRAVVCRHFDPEPDHRDSIGSVEDLLLLHAVPGLMGVDTRTITRRVREYGTLLAVIGPLDEEEQLAERLAKLEDPSLDDLVDIVSIDTPRLVNPDATDAEGERLPRLASLDCGIKYNILRQLCQRFEVLWCPPDIEYQVLRDEWEIDALFCSNGPGDPAHQGKAMIARRTLAAGIADGLPSMGICLGHQLLGLGAGLQTYKMLYGHRGANQPVIDLDDGRVSITSQNHGFAVADPVQGRLAAHPSGADSGPAENLLGFDVRVRHVNSNDRTVEGLEVVGRPAFSVQYHPEASPGPHDASPLFDRFASMVRAEMTGGAV